MVTVPPFVDEGLGNSSYLAEIGDGRGLVVDPPRDIQPFLARATDRRIRLSHSLETHLHADFVSGSRELAAKGAQILAPRDAGLAFGHTPLDDGEDVDLGGLRIRPIAIPATRPSTSDTCWSTAIDPSRCSRGAHSCPAALPGPTSSRRSRPIR